ncbi:hypothetical protein J6590_013536 [Homalodisca vitripennis]|nr:hypothetical protein J6590_013536 [Homalodisca vitripennis]
MPGFTIAGWKNVNHPRALYNVNNSVHFRRRDLNPEFCAFIRTPQMTQLRALQRVARCSSKFI